jgi:gamma-glutamylcyclotransferase (GGCT)/AIG2-like uncharacterized protein YtfP
MTDTRYLFVYGTLMSGAGSALGRSQRLRLARESDSLGPASIAHAQLYDLGRYPGAIAGGGEDDLVHGEAVLLSTPQAALKWLDAYEGDEYERTICSVRLAGGEAIDAWVYLLRNVPERAKRIGDGRWMPR